MYETGFITNYREILGINKPLFSLLTVVDGVLPTLWIDSLFRTRLVIEFDCVLKQIKAEYRLFSQLVRVFKSQLKLFCLPPHPFSPFETYFLKFYVRPIEMSDSFRQFPMLFCK